MAKSKKNAHHKHIDAFKKGGLNGVARSCVRRAKGFCCLNMIMRDEENVLPRLLANMGHIVDAVAVVDTGSVDNSIKIVTEWCDKNKIPCEIITRFWEDDFGKARTQALRHGEKVVEKILAKELLYSPETTQEEHWYLLFMDCDNLCWDYDCVSPITINKSKMGDDAYRIETRSEGNSIVYSSTWMVRVDPQKHWIWYGPRHEFVSPEKARDGTELWSPIYGTTNTGFVRSNREGARSKDDHKYMRDAIAFERALLDDPLNDRYLYYVAQSYRDAAVMYNKQACSVKAKDIQEYARLVQKAVFCYMKAEKAYLYRASVPPFHLWKDEYTYLAWVEAGKARLARKGDVYDSKSLEYFSKAYDKRPHRMEAIYHLINNCVRRETWRIGWILAKEVVDMPYPEEERMFVDQEIHKFRLYFVASLCAYYSGNKSKFLSLTNKVIECPSTTESVRNTAKANLENFGK